METDRNIIDFIKSHMVDLHKKRSRSDGLAIILFLDIDGTISEFHIDPEQSFIAPEILGTIEHLNQIIDVFLVTGRSVQQAQHLISPFDWNIAASHGLELYHQQQTQNLIHFNHTQFNALKTYLREAIDTKIPIRIEEKPFSIALHFREHPELERFAQNFIKQCLEHYDDFELKLGKYVFELVAKGCHKGIAIQHILSQTDDQNLCPIFIGDDLTDESGFEVINQHHGISIKVVSGLSQAKFRLKNVTAVGCFLQDLLKELKVQQHIIGESNVKTHCIV